MKSWVEDGEKVQPPPQKKNPTDKATSVYYRDKRLEKVLSRVAQGSYKDGLSTVLVALDPRVILVNLQITRSELIIFTR